METDTEATFLELLPEPPLVSQRVLPFLVSKSLVLMEVDLTLVFSRVSNSVSSPFHPANKILTELSVQQDSVGKRAVMNMSLGGPRSQAVNAAVNALSAQGVIPVVAAGNENVSIAK